MHIEEINQFVTPAYKVSSRFKTHSLPNYEMDAVIANFPKTRYYGSKRRLLGWIYQELKDLPFNTVLDGFGGTASVSLLFKAMGKQVNFHDALLCNTIAAKALLVNGFLFSEK